MKTIESSYVSREESFEIENPRVSVETVSSNVEIIESTDGKCHVEISVKSGSADQLAEAVEITAKNGRVSVCADKGNHSLRGLFSGKSPELHIVIKLAKTGVLKVKTVSADIEINQVLLNVEVGSVSGNITVLQNPSQVCTLKTVSGDVTAHTFSACQYSLKSISGDISVHVAPGLEVDVDGKSLSGKLESEITLSSNNGSFLDSSKLVTINTSTVSGDFHLVRN
jgi:DUF4097 and DUF4098 domain-containing protein YvlB